MADWNAATYDRFEAERARPSRDLVARVTDLKPRRIADLGCGSGLSTLELRRAFPKARLTGIDTSPDMLKAAAKRLPGVEFTQGDAADFDASGFDLVFANAVFHWVPGHIAVLARLAATLPKGGALAVQMPDNEDEPSHRLMRAIAGRDSGAREVIGGFADYETALCPPCAELDMWRTTYVHRLAGAAEIVKWVEGAGLRPYLDPLDPPARAAFLAAYGEAVAEAYPPEANGTTLFAFPRLFLVGRRG